MSQTVRDFEKSWTSTNDLSLKQFYIVKVDPSNDNSVVLAAAGTDKIVGVLQNKPKATSAALVRFLGTTKVIAGGTIARGDRVTSDASGKAITTITNKDVAVGVACQSAVAGDILEIQILGFTPMSL